MQEITTAAWPELLKTIQANHQTLVALFSADW